MSTEPIEIEVKTARIQRFLDLNRLTGVILNAQHNFAWASGGASNAVNTSSDFGVASLLFTNEGKRFVLANNIEMERILAEEFDQNCFSPITFPWQEEKSNPDILFEISAKILRTRNGIASDVVANREIKLAEGSFASCRFELTPLEIERYRELGADSSNALSLAIRRISPGMSEKTISRIVSNELEKMDIRSVVSLVGADDRIFQFRHPVPTENVWRNLLVIVVCARRKGLIANLSRFVSIGNPPSDFESRLYNCGEVFARIAAATKPGISGAMLYQVAEEAYEHLGFGGEIDHHHQGGATGYKTREWVCHPSMNETVRNNQAFAWNPSIAGAKVEETFIVSENGVEIITDGGEFPRFSVVSDDLELRLPGILVK